MPLNVKIPDILKLTVYSVRRTLGNILAIAVPETCVVCGRTLVDGEKVMCTACLLDLPRTNLHRSGSAPQAEALARTARFEDFMAWFHYNRQSAYAELIRTAKYHDCPQIGKHLGRMYAQEILSEKPGRFDDFDVLLPVPMHYVKRLRRGYNQSVEIAHGISEATGIPVGDNLTAFRSHRTQTHRSAAERLHNVADRFGVKNAEELDGLHVLIVDDVITTGATIGECGRTLLTHADTKAVSAIALGLTRNN